MGPTPFLEESRESKRSVGGILTETSQVCGDTGGDRGGKGDKKTVLL